MASIGENSVIGRSRGIFDAVSHLTVGVEEELFLVDPRTFQPLASGPDLVEQLGDDRFHCEYSPAQIELVTEPQATATEAVAELLDRRRALLAAAGGELRVVGVGAHPFAYPLTDSTHSERYAALLEEQELGVRLAGSAAGLHVHVGVQGAERALRVYNALRGCMPLVTALAANAPFIGGVDSGWATVRPKLCDALPRQGVGPVLDRWADFTRLLTWGAHTGAVPDASQFWWECRLNTRLGTVEVRTPDAQASLVRVHAVAAVVHALVAHMCERIDAGERLPVYATWKIEENRWRAARSGVTGELVDLAAGRFRPARVLINELLDRINAAAGRCGAADGLDAARLMVEEDMPAQHRWIARRGMPALAEWLAEGTEASVTAWSNTDTRSTT